MPYKQDAHGMFSWKLFPMQEDKFDKRMLEWNVDKLLETGTVGLGICAPIWK